MVVQAFAKRFSDQRKIGLAPGDLKQIAAPQTLEPQGRSLPGRRAWQEQCPGGILTKAQGEERAVGQFAKNQLFHVLGCDAIEQVEHWLVGIGQANQKAVVVMETLRRVT